MSAIFDDTKWFASRPNLGVDYLLVVNLCAGGTYECSSREEAISIIKEAVRKGGGYGLSTKEIT